MLLIGTKASTVPAKVSIEKLETKRRVILSDHIEQVEDPEDTGFVYDEVVFFMPDDRSDTLAEIEANFDAWWEYGKEDFKEPTLEERISDLETLVLTITEG